jgi:MFS family permease
MPPAGRFGHGPKVARTSRGLVRFPNMSPTENKPAMAGNEQPGERVWPVATVMATGIFATTFVQLQAMGSLPFSHLLMNTMGLDSNAAATFITVWCTLPWSFKIVAGLLVDGVPLFNSRRRNYLLLSSVTAGVLWLAIGLMPPNYNLLLVLAVTMNVAIVFGSTTSGGLLVEAGQRFGASGRLSSLRMMAQNLGAALGLLLGGLIAAKTMTGNRPLGWTSVAASVPLGCMFISAWFFLKEPPPPPRGDHGRSFGEGIYRVVISIWTQIRNVLRREMLLPASLMLFLQAVPTFRSTCLYEYQTKSLNYTDAALGLLGFAGYGAAIFSSGVYAWWRRRIPLRTSLYCGVALMALSALPYLFYNVYTPYMPRAFAIESSGTFLYYLAYLPLMDMAVRSTPKGSEALGYSFFISVWNIGLMIGTKTGPMLYEKVFHHNMGSLIWLNASVTLLGALFVFSLPKTLVERREGK